jgi:hypothetical protein
MKGVQALFHEEVLKKCFAVVHQPDLIQAKAYSKLYYRMIPGNCKARNPAFML